MAPHRRRNPARQLADINAEEAAELNTHYWTGNLEREELVRRSGLSPTDFDRLIDPVEAPGSCPRCAGPLTWTSRTARREQRRRCSTCGHWVGGACTCRACRAERAEHRRALDVAEALRRETAVREWEETYADPRYLDRALRDLTAAQRAFLESIRKHWDSGLSWTSLAQSAGIDERHIDRYLNRFTTMGLLFSDGRALHLHPHVLTGGPLLLR